MHVNPEIAKRLEALNNPSLPGVDLTLDRMWQLLAELGYPHGNLPPTIHVAGTNGKGSTIAFLRAIYTAAGYRVHAYTSPHLVCFNERIVVEGEEIDDSMLLSVLKRVDQAAKKTPVTFFEATTALAFLAFSENDADILLLETGLGGRLDATNVLNHPALTIITPIDYDHMEFLGNKLTQIAQEKAGIIKPGVPCLVGRQRPEVEAVLREVAANAGAPILVEGTEWNYGLAGEKIEVCYGGETWLLPKPALVGEHQHHNAALACVAAYLLESLPIYGGALAIAMREVSWPARLQKLTNGPLVTAWGNRGAVMLDGGHNVSAAETLAQWASGQASITLLCGMMARKDAKAFFTPLAGKVREVITVPISELGSYDPATLAEQARLAGISKVKTANSIEEAIKTLKDCGGGTLLVAGSLFLAGEILKNHG